MNNQQLYLTIAVAPILSLVIVLAGYIVQNVNLNARVADIKADMRDLLNAHTAALRAEMAALRETVQAELNAMRSEIAKNHSELLTKLAEERFRPH
ncbi:exported hypothetical protein [Candidatus Sulfopaludibacter sp. SbA4]|nr:exported hypothetical protein [Candidatus Sulfopaludibacter sp. SbA4]